MSIVFPCPLCGHQITAPKTQAGERVTCQMCNFKVEVPKAVVVPPRPKATPPPAAPAKIDPAPPAPAEESASFETLPTTPGFRARRLAPVVALLVAVCLAGYWAVTTPAIARYLPAFLRFYNPPSAPPLPPGPLSPADYQ
jgi:DNA-directed RNA polymerase subunit RPC12/RpoP